jgi:phosphoribosyl-ATP pyrophosphohydrolase
MALKRELSAYKILIGKRKNSKPECTQIKQQHKYGTNKVQKKAMEKLTSSVS